MDPYTLTAIVLSLAVLIAIINHHTIKLQMTIAIMAGSLLISLFLLILEHIGFSNIAIHTKELLLETHFHRLLINGMLSFLLFAGALTIDFEHFKNQIWEIGILATITTIFSTGLIGVALYALLPLFHINMPLLFCFLFGALISPTDPIAVLATFKEVNAPKKLETCVAGESLFNDGVGIVIFLTLYQLTFNGAPITFSSVSQLFLQQAIGGIGFGLILGFLAKKLITLAQDHRIAILITLAIVTGGYNLALTLSVSGPLAMVVAGIFVANTTRSDNVSGQDILHLFWEIIDDILNAVLFLLIGFELLVIHVSWGNSLLALSAIPLVLLARLVTVAIPMKLLQLTRTPEPFTITILTWGGLRGGLAVALALSLPSSSYRDLILLMTFAVVAFAIIIQGITIKPLAKLAKN